MRRFIFLLGPAWVLCVIFLGLRSAEAQKLRVAWTAVSALNAPYWVMKDGGFFKQEGLDVDLVYIPSSTVVASAMLAGEAAISTANSQVVVDSGLQGSDLVIIGGVVNVAAFYIMAVPEVRSVQDLRGKPVGITRFSASTDFSLRMLLKKYGLEPVRDVPILQIGGMPEIAAALSKKTIYAAHMSYPMSYVAQQAGMKLISNLAKEDIPFVHVAITTTRRFMQEHRNQARAVVRAYGRAIHFMHTKKEDFKKIMARYTKVNDPGMLEGSVQYAYDFLEKIPLVKPAAIQVNLDEAAQRNAKARQVKVEQFYDNSVVQELISEGFFVSLWGNNP